jgi:CheY-like chemotaxis protein
MKVLIVDDNPLMREMVRQYLPVMTDEVREVDDGALAVAAYRDFLPDFVLMDWQMKLMDGLTATRRIVGDFPNARILIVTQFDDRELRSAASEAGAVGFVLKEDLQSLRSILKEQQI